MKAAGCSGVDVITALVSNSATFASKTSFAQEKYIKRKQLKCVICCGSVKFAHTAAARTAAIDGWQALFLHCIYRLSSLFHVVNGHLCRHVRRFRIERPTARSICDALALKEWDKMWFV